MNLSIDAAQIRPPAKYIGPQTAFAANFLGGRWFGSLGLHWVLRSYYLIMHFIVCCYLILLPTSYGKISNRHIFFNQYTKKEENSERIQLSWNCYLFYHKIASHFFSQKNIKHLVKNCFGNIAVLRLFRNTLMYRNFFCISVLDDILYNFFLQIRRLIKIYISSIKNLNFNSCFFSDGEKVDRAIEILRQLSEDWSLSSEKGN